MSTDTDVLDKHTTELEDLLRRECVERGLDFASIQGNLQFRWMRAALAERIAEQTAADAPFKTVLERALRCQQTNDKTGYRQACLEWLKLRHDVQLGDTVVLGGWARPREVRIEDFHIPRRRRPHAEELRLVCRAVPFTYNSKRQPVESRAAHRRFSPKGWLTQKLQDFIVSNTSKLKTPGRPCLSCPWRKTSTVADIPNFSMEMAEDLSNCSPDSRNVGPEWNAKLFACHQSKPDAEFVCAGWLATVGHRHPQVRFEVFSQRLEELTLSPGPDWPELHGSYPEVLEKLRATLPETIEKEEQ